MEDTGTCRTAMVCYCLLDMGNGAERIDDQMQQVQELFQQSGFDQVFQAFAVNRQFPASVPFQEYPPGFLARTGMEDDGRMMPEENLILSYGLFRALADDSKRKTGREYYLVLLREGETEQEDQELIQKILEKYRDLKEKMEITVICLAHPDGLWETWEQEFADICGIETLKFKQSLHGGGKE